MGVRSGAALGLLDRLIESSGILREPPHLSGGEGSPEFAVVIALPSTQPLVEFVGEVERVAGEVERIMGMFTANDGMIR